MARKGHNFEIQYNYRLGFPRKSGGLVKDTLFQPSTFTGEYHIAPIEVGDKLTFQWKPGYRGPWWDGETVYAVVIEEGGLKVRYRLEVTLSRNRRRQLRVVAFIAKWLDRTP